MLHHRGLRISAVGAVVFIASLLSLLVLPPAVSIIGLLAGGLAVWGGFIWTLFSYYGQPPAGQ